MRLSLVIKTKLQHWFSILTKFLLPTPEEAVSLCSTLYERSTSMFFFEKIPELEIIVWSAGHRDHVDCVLDPSQTLVSHAICCGSSWMDKIPVFKNISCLGSERTIIVDDSVYVAAANGSRAIIIPQFLAKHPCSAVDTTLLYV